MSVHPLHAMELDGLGGIRHGFFTRAGGVSTGIYHGLNCGPGSNDDPSAVELNRTRVAIHLQVAPENLLSLYQIHSGKAVTVTKPWDAENRPQADGMATATRGLALGILTADCAPVLFADPKAKVIGAAHAGWRGALDGVLEATIDAMEDVGATRANIVAVIGPTISQRNYEVGPEFLDTFLAEAPENARFFANGEGDRLQFDLPGYGLHRLREAGVGHAEWTRHCTYDDDARFYSYRRSTHAREVDYGRLLSAIRL